MASDRKSSGTVFAYFICHFITPCHRYVVNYPVKNKNAVEALRNTWSQQRYVKVTCKQLFWGQPHVRCPWTKGWHNYVWITCTQGIHSQTVLINTLDWHSANTWSTLHNTSVDTPLTPNNIRGGQQSFKSHIHFDCCNTWVGWHSTNYWPTVDWDSIKCWLSIDWYVTEDMIEGNHWHSTLDAIWSNYVCAENIKCTVYTQSCKLYALDTVSESFYSLPLPVVLIIKSNSIFQKLQLFHIFWCPRFVKFWTESFACFVFLESYLIVIKKQTKMLTMALEKSLKKIESDPTEKSRARKYHFNTINGLLLNDKSDYFS